MIKSICFALLLAAAVLLPCRSDAASLGVTLTLSDLPTTVTLCRDLTAITSYQVDEQWQIGINTDGSIATGDGGGTDAILVIETLPQMPPCSAHMVALDANALVAFSVLWDQASQQFQYDTSLEFSVDTTANTLTVNATPAIAAEVTGASTLSVAGAAAYTPSGNSSTLAYDNAGPLAPTASLTDPVGDVQACTSPCSPMTAYYPMIDIVKAQAQSGLVAAAADAEFTWKLDSLPAMITLCRDPAVFMSMQTNVDSVWAGYIDVDGSQASGYQGSEAAILVYTTPQSQNCTTSMAAIDQSLYGEIDTLDSGGFLNFLAGITVSVDAASGVITAHLPYDNPIAKMLTPSSKAVARTFGFYSQTNAQDVATLFDIGTSFADPRQDVLYCTVPCATGASWYPQTDLVGGSFTRADRLFASGFEP
jgi:hypothetical protein